MDQELLDGIRQIVREEISEVKDDVSSLKGDVSSLKSDVSSLKTDVSSLKNDVSSLKTDVAEMKTTLDKNNHLLRVLRIKTDTNEIKLSIISDKIDRFIDNQKWSNESQNKLKDHHHQIVIETGEPVFDE